MGVVERIVYNIASCTLVQCAGLPRHRSPSTFAAVLNHQPRVWLGYVSARVDLLCNFHFFVTLPHALQDDLQAQITGALGQLSRASALLTSHNDPAATAQLDDLLEEVIRQQNEISDKHAAWADATGADASRTMNLGITGAVTRQATQRCAFIPL